MLGQDVPGAHQASPSALASTALGCSLYTYDLTHTSSTAQYLALSCLYRVTQMPAISFYGPMPSSPVLNLRLILCNGQHGTAHDGPKTVSVGCGRMKHLAAKQKQHSSGLKVQCGAIPCPLPSPRILRS